MAQVLLLALLSGAEAAVSTDPPVITLDLEGANLIKYDTTAHGKVGANNYCATHPSSELCRDTTGTDANGKTYVETYMKQCEVQTSDEDSCPMPSAHAYDHHDEAATQVQTDIQLFIRSDPRGTPDKVRETVDDIDYDVRGEYLLSFNAADRSGNQAEEANFAMVMIDHVAPTIHPILALSWTTEAMDRDADYHQMDTPRFFDFPAIQVVADDAYDGDVTDQMTITVTAPTDSVSIATYGPGGITANIPIDTYYTGTWDIEYGVHDFADIFGPSNQNNTNSLSATVDVVDTMPPVVHCRPSTPITQSGVLDAASQIGDPHTLVTTDDGPTPLEECSEKCFQSQYEKAVGTHSASRSCAYFQVSMDECFLHDEFAVVAPVGADADSIVGYLLQCNAVNTYECGSEPDGYEDPGAYCIDQQGSWDPQSDSIDPELLDVETNSSVSSLPGTYSIVYQGCHDNGDLGADNKVRSVDVVDTTPPDFEASGCVDCQESCHDATRELKRMRTRDNAVGYTCSDSCTTCSCVTTVHLHNCSGP